MSRITRRSFLIGLGGLIAAPAIVRFESLMPVKSLILTDASGTPIDTLIANLKAQGVWEKLDALYVFAAEDAETAKINWKTSRLV
jgi:hypothetical protein